MPLEILLPGYLSRFIPNTGRAPGKSMIDAESDLTRIRIGNSEERESWSFWFFRITKEGGVV